MSRCCNGPIQYKDFKAVKEDTRILTKVGITNIIGVMIVIYCHVVTMIIIVIVIVRQWKVTSQWTAHS